MVKRKKIEEFKDAILHEHSEGKSLKEICKVVGFYPDKISKYLKSLGLKPNKYHKTKWVNEHFFDCIDSEEKAYILGFFIADGCIRDEFDKRTGSTYKRLCFSNSIDDFEIIDKIHSVLCPENKMLYAHNKSGSLNRKEQIKLQWTSRVMCETLEVEYGIKPRKTMDIEYEFPFNKIDKKYFRDFIRGFIDGDGTISKEDIRFVFNSKKFAEQIVEILRNEVYLPNKDVIYDFSYKIDECNGKTTNYWRLRIPTGHGKYKFYRKYLYDNATMFLTRKKEKISDYD